MPKFEIRLEQAMVEGRSMIIEAPDLKTAKRRAIACNAGELNLGAGEDAGEWCDGGYEPLRVVEAARVEE